MYLTPRLTSLLLLLPLLGVHLQTTLALDPSNTNTSTFTSPPSSTRLKFRYWLPDASVNTTVVASDILSAASIGAGGIEFVPLYNYGASLAPPPEGADWAKYGFGTAAFNEVFEVALSAARDAGMVFDFALGPNQGQGVPVDLSGGDPEGVRGLHWDLAPFNASVSANGSYTGTIPGWGTGELVALVSGEVLSSSIITNPASATFSTPSTNSTRLVLRASSLTDQTSRVREDGTINLHFNSTENNDYRLFAYYQYHDLVKNLDIQTNTTGTLFDNGSYTVDHFSSRGAQTTIDFWEKYILNDTEIRDLLYSVGRYAWEDSLEIESNISWTPSLPELFKTQHGYDLKTYLPLIQFGNNNPGVQPSYPGDLACVLDTSDGGKGVVNDYRETLAAGYQSYLSTLSNWAESLGLEYSSQVSYNLPLDMEASIPFVRAPECESLAFNDNIDGYRQFSGPAHLSPTNKNSESESGGKIISNEMGGDLRKSFRLTISTLLWQINSAFSGGVNQIVLHGQTYTGDYYDTTWPGYTAFFMLFSDSYNDKQPAWGVTYPGMIGYVSRAQYVLQSGVQKADVVFYNKASVTDPQVGTVYGGGDLVEGGYTYEYLSPDNLDSNLTTATVGNGVFDERGPAYQAFAVLAEQNVTLDAVQKMQQFASDGLPVLLVGGMPGYYPSGTGKSEKEQEEAVLEAVQNLQGSKNVYNVESNGIATKLAALNINPRVAVQTNGTWYPIYRTDNETEIDYVFVFSNPESDSNSGSVSIGSITVQTTKTPYILNAWSGHRAPVLHYTVNKQNGTTTIPMTLASNQTFIYAFSDDLAGEIDTLSTHALNLPNTVLGYNYTTEKGLALHISTSTSSKNRTISFSNGKVHDIPGPKSHLPEFPLSNWTLTAEHWTAPTNFSAAYISAKRYNTTHSLTEYGDSIPSWLEIEDLKNVSGVGYYSTFFNWPPTTSTTGGVSANITAGMGAYISLPPSAHGLQVYINGHQIPGIDFTSPLADVGSYLVSGRNKVEVVVPTVMWNYIRSLYDKIEIAGSEPLLETTGALPGLVETGLIGTVRVLPYFVSWVGV